jgi:biotin carboxyl carrier protein
MRRYRITLEGQTFDVEVLSDPRLSEVRVRVDGTELTVNVESAVEPSRPAVTDPPPVTVSPPPTPLTATAGPSARSGTAPLPGTVKSVAVQAGTQVVAGDELLVVEAMKMDNTIRAERSGTIAAVHVTEGKQIAYGEPLLDFTD